MAAWVPQALNGCYPAAEGRRISKKLVEGCPASYRSPMTANQFILRTCLLLIAAGTTMPSLAIPAAQQEQTGAPAVPRGKKLMLKDGSFQLVRTWERVGQRVRFYSIERSGWEEIPADMVDWAATETAQAEAARAVQEANEKLKTVEKQQLAQEIDVDASIEIAPGMFLPEGEGIFILECDPENPANPRPATARCAVLTLTQISTQTKVDKKQLLKQIFTPIPIVAGKHRISAAGKAAEIRLRNTQPEFYLRVADDREPEVELIRAQVKGERREISVVSTNIAGEKRDEYKAVAVQRWQMARRVFRLTLGETLTAGEYALAEFLPGEGINLYVWDFGIDAPAGSRPASAKKKQAP